MSNHMDKYTQFISEQIRKSSTGTVINEQLSDLKIPDGYKVTLDKKNTDTKRPIHDVVRTADRKKIGAIGSFGGNVHSSWGNHPKDKSNDAIEAHYAHPSAQHALDHLVKRYKEREAGSPQKPTVYNERPK